MTCDGTAVRPVQQTPRGFGAETVGLRQDANPAQIQTVRIPAGLQGGRGVDQAVGVQPARLIEQFKSGIVQMHQFSTQRPGELASSQSMGIVAKLVHPTRIVEEGEEGHHLGIRPVRLGDLQAVFQHAGPMDDAVVAVDWQCVSGEDGF